MAHASLKLGLAETSRHANELFRPQLLKVADFATRHDNGTDDSKLVVAKELVLLEAE
jgi:hypothetical protein